MTFALGRSGSLPLSSKGGETTATTPQEPAWLQGQMRHAFNKENLRCC